VTSTSSTAPLARRVRLISWLSLAWMSIEGVVGVAAGVATNSLVLLGYGLDSTIQGIGSLVIIWRGDPLVALILAAVTVHTGVNTWRGRGCTPAH
jgi:hypothetical protein